MEKKKYQCIVRNDPFNPATIFENVIFILGAGGFTVFTCMAIADKSFVPAIGLFAFVAICLFLLYENNAAVAFITKENIIIRKFLKKYKYSFSDFKSVTHYDMLCKYVFNFSGKVFKIPDYYWHIKMMLRILNSMSSYFATEEGIERLKSYIKEHACKESFALIPVKGKEMTLTCSKLGGIPYWDLKQEYPVDENGKKMQLLCQLNFSECRYYENDLLPKNGILQFFISSTDECYGVNWYNFAEQKNWKVVFHEKIDENITLEDVKNVVPDFSEVTSTPVINCTALEFRKSVSYMASDDYRMDSLIRDAVYEITGVADFEGSIYDLLGPSDINVYADEVYNMIMDSENHILGYPSFVQNDVRNDMSDADADYFDTTLLHLDSCAGDGEEMCWGDMGVANFLINSEALKKHDFSKVLYTWDCA